MTSLFCNLIGAWKFLSAGPRIRPKFTRPFSSLEVGSGHETKTSTALVLHIFIIHHNYVLSLEVSFRWLIENTDAKIVLQFLTGGISPSHIHPPPSAIPPMFHSQKISSDKPWSCPQTPAFGRSGDFGQ